jgi:hypothetical protein
MIYSQGLDLFVGAWFICRGLIYQAHLIFTIKNEGLMNQTPTEEK